MIENPTSTGNSCFTDGFRKVGNSFLHCSIGNQIVTSPPRPKVRAITQVVKQNRKHLRVKSRARNSQNNCTFEPYKLEEDEDEIHNKSVKLIRHYILKLKWELGVVKKSTAESHLFKSCVFVFSGINKVKVRNIFFQIC